MPRIRSEEVPALKDRRAKGWLARAKRQYIEHQGVPLTLLLVSSVLLYVGSLSDSLSVARAALDLHRELGSASGSADPQRDIFEALRSAQHRSSVREALFHLALAFFISFIVILLVELAASKRRREEMEKYRYDVANDVWKTLFARMVPKRLVDEIEGLFRSTVIKEDCRYVLSFLDGYSGLPPGCLVLKRDVKYVLRNITPGPVSKLVRCFTHNEFPNLTVTSPTGETIDLPQHTALDVNRKEVKLKEFLKPHAGLPNRMFEYPLTLKKKERVEIFMSSLELVKDQDKSYYAQLVPLDGLEVRIDTTLAPDIEILEVVLHHPKRDEFLPGRNGEYVFDGGVLPGQSFALTWKKKKAPIAGA
jgi:hypothetical protein